MNIVLNRPENERLRHSMADEPGKLFIGAVSSQVTKEEFQAFFEKFGEVSDIVLMFDKETKRNRGFGFVTFKDPACAKKVLDSVPLKLGGREIDPKPSVQRGQLPPNTKPPPNKSLDKKVFVGGVSQSTNEEGLRTFFNSKNLVVKDVVLMHDNQTLKSRGFGFVTFVDDETVENVCRQRFFNIDYKTVECKRAEPRGGKNEMGMGPGPGGPGGPAGNFNQMQQRGFGPNMGGGGGGPNMGGGFNQGWNQNQNPGFPNNQYNQGMGNYGQQGGWGQHPQQGPMGNFPQQPQQQGYGPRGGQMPNQGGFRGQYNNGNAGYNQPGPQQQQGGYSGGYPQQQQQQQQQQPPAQQQQQQPQQQPQQQQGTYGRPNASGDGLPAKSPQLSKPLVPPQSYGNNYGNYGQQQQQPQQQQQQQPRQQQPEPFQGQPQQANQGYNTGNYGTQSHGNYNTNGSMGNYPQEASGYGPQRVNYNAPAQPNFNQPQGTGYGGDMSGGFQPQGPQQHQQPPQQQQQQQQQQPPPQQHNYQPQQDTSQDVYNPQPGGNFARSGNNAALPFHPYRR